MIETSPRSADVRRRVTIGLAVVIGATAFGWLVSSAGATATRAQLPPIVTFPEAGDAAPPPGANDPASPGRVCTDWYRRNDYFGQDTGSAWWEYSCRYEWPVLGVGATTSEWSGQYISTAYFYWTGSEAAHYGTAMYDGYSDSLFTATNCDYWTDETTGRSYGPYALTAPGQCVG